MDCTTAYAVSLLGGMMTTVLMRLLTVVRCITVTQGSRRSSRKGVSLEFDLHERAPLLEVPAVCVILRVERQLSLRPHADDVVARGGRHGEEAEKWRESSHAACKIARPLPRRAGGGEEKPAPRAARVRDRPTRSTTPRNACSHARKAPRLGRSR